MKLIIKPNKKTIAFRMIFIIIMLFVFISILLVDYLNLLSDKQVLKAIGLPSAYIGLICCALLIRRLAYLKGKKSSLVIINELGLNDVSTPLSVGLIKWSEIKQVLPVKFLGLKFIGVILKKPEETLSRVKPFKRLLIKLNQATVKVGKTKVPVVIGIKMLDVPSSKIIELCNHYIKK